MKKLHMLSAIAAAAAIAGTLTLTACGGSTPAAKPVAGTIVAAMQIQNDGYTVTSGEINVPGELSSATGTNSSGGAELAVVYPSAAAAASASAKYAAQVNSSDGLNGSPFVSIALNNSSVMLVDGSSGAIAAFDSQFG
jgi:hypothetical protein